MMMFIFGENNEVWIRCLWFDDLFCDDDFLIYTSKMMNCICWVDTSHNCLCVWWLLWLVICIL